VVCCALRWPARSRCSCCRGSCCQLCGGGACGSTGGSAGSTSQRSR
jgi:hypothetical protein